MDNGNVATDHTINKNVFRKIWIVSKIPQSTVSCEWHLHYGGLPYDRSTMQSWFASVQIFHTMQYFL